MSFVMVVITRFALYLGCNGNVLRILLLPTSCLGLCTRHYPFKVRRKVSRAELGP